LLDVPSGQGPCWSCVPPSWPWLTRQALLREPARRHVSPGQRALAAPGYWRLQTGPHCDAGPSLRSPVPAAGTRTTLCHLGLAGSPHQPRRGQRQRLGRFLWSLFLLQQVLPCSRGAARSGGAGEALTPLWARACRPSRLKHFSTQVCVETCKG